MSVRSIWLLLCAGFLLTSPASAQISSVDPDTDTRTWRLRELLAEPIQERNAGWRQSFYAMAIEAPLFAPILQPQVGPDGFPYLVLYSQSDQDSVPVVTVAELLPRLTEVGVGIVLDPGQEGEPEPGWVFHYGDLLCHRLYGSFEVRTELTRSPAEDDATTLESPNGEVKVAPPSESYLPQYTRDVLREFLKSTLGMEEPAVVLMQRAGLESEPELAFNIFPEGFEDPKMLQALLVDLTWFVPRHYTLTAISSKALPASAFAKL